MSGLSKAFTGLAVAAGLGTAGVAGYSAYQDHLDQQAKTAAAQEAGLYKNLVAKSASETFVTGMAGYLAVCENNAKGEDKQAYYTVAIAVSESDTKARGGAAEFINNLSDQEDSPVDIFTSESFTSGVVQAQRKAVIAFEKQYGVSARIDLKKQPNLMSRNDGPESCMSSANYSFPLNFAM